LLKVLGLFFIWPSAHSPRRRVLRGVPAGDGPRANSEGKLVGEMGIEPTPEPPKDSALPLQLLPDLVDCADGSTSICAAIMAP
jgi:hypothetical protein